jgi:hypothetical protein
MSLLEELSPILYLLLCLLVLLWTVLTGDVACEEPSAKSMEKVLVLMSRA